MPVLHSFKSALAKKAIAAMRFDKKIPKTVEGAGCVGNVAAVAKDLNISRPLVVTDEVLVKLGVADPVFESLKREGLEYGLFDKVLPDPTEDLVLAGAKAYHENKCDGIIAFGGGSSIDCAKVIGGYVVDPKPVSQYAGMGKITKQIPPFIAIPTTAGTGSETTFAAVIRDDKEQIKYLVGGLEILPKVAILDPELLIKLPKTMTAATGMDALTHAVEAYTNTWATDLSRKWSREAIKRIFGYLLRCYNDGSDLEARSQLLRGSFEAGVAISMAGVGYVHAIAHTVGGKFHTPHGVANAMIMPFVLDFFDEAVEEDLADLAIMVGIGNETDSRRALAKNFIAAIRRMHSDMNMPTTVKGMKRKDVTSIATRALNEAHGDLSSKFFAPKSWLMDPGYPVPKYMNLAECEKIVSSLLEPEPRL
mmetsp:Transcript_17472/g.21149  ORF Transcript_17472/g.21149 Transcript_17472/m.21149 type:complete len:421 (+) Transcript_17472:113-1375(+)